MITREFVDMTVDRIYSHYEYMASVDDVVQTCGYGRTYKPEWHVFDKDDFDEICDLVDVEPTLVNDHHYAITYNGVYIFYVI